MNMLAWGILAAVLAYNGYKFSHRRRTADRIFRLWKNKGPAWAEEWERKKGQWTE